MTQFSEHFFESLTNFTSPCYVHRILIIIVRITKSHPVQIFIRDGVSPQSNSNQNADHNTENAADDPEPSQNAATSFQLTAIQEIVNSLRLHVHDEFQTTLTGKSFNMNEMKTRSRVKRQTTFQGRITTNLCNDRWCALRDSNNLLPVDASVDKVSRE